MQSPITIIYKFTISISKAKVKRYFGGLIYVLLLYVFQLSRIKTMAVTAHFSSKQSLHRPFGHPPRSNARSFRHHCCWCTKFASNLPNLMDHCLWNMCSEQGQHFGQSTYEFRRWLPSLSSRGYRIHHSLQEL